MKDKQIILNRIKLIYIVILNTCASSIENILNEIRI